MQVQQGKRNLPVERYPNDDDRCACQRRAGGLVTCICAVHGFYSEHKHLKRQRCRINAAYAISIGAPRRTTRAQRYATSAPDDEEPALRHRGRLARLRALRQRRPHIYPIAEKTIREGNGEAKREQWSRTAQKV